MIKPLQPNPPSPFLPNLYKNNVMTSIHNKATFRMIRLTFKLTFRLTA